MHHRRNCPVTSHSPATLQPSPNAEYLKLPRPRKTNSQAEPEMSTYDHPHTFTPSPTQPQPKPHPRQRPLRICANQDCCICGCPLGLHQHVVYRLKGQHDRPARGLTCWHLAHDLATESSTHAACVARQRPTICVTRTKSERQTDLR